MPILDAVLPGGKQLAQVGSVLGLLQGDAADGALQVGLGELAALAGGEFAGDLSRGERRDREGRDSRRSEMDRDAPGKRAPGRLPLVREMVEDRLGEAAAIIVARADEKDLGRGSVSHFRSHAGYPPGRQIETRSRRGHLRAGSEGSLRNLENRNRFCFACADDYRRRMRILVIGASRGIGLATVRKALAEGHVVTAFMRPTSTMVLADPRLTILRGDILDESQLEPAVAACNAVAITLGVPPSRQPITLFSEFTGHLLAVMQRTGPRRVLAVSGIGAGDSRGHGGFLYDRIVQPLLLASNYADKERMEERLRDWSGDWLIVRPGFLTNGPETGSFDVLTDLTGVTAGKISRGDVARFLVQEMAAPTLHGQTVLLTAPRR